MKTPTESDSEVEKTDPLISTAENQIVQEVLNETNIEELPHTSKQQILDEINHEKFVISDIKNENTNGKQIYKTKKKDTDTSGHRVDHQIEDLELKSQVSDGGSSSTSDNPPEIENESEIMPNFDEDEEEPINLIDSSHIFNNLLLRKESHQFCRICHEVGTEDVFISPCRCKGSLSLVHKWCLERWLAESDTNHCELCGFVFNVNRRPKYNIICSLFLWLWKAAPRRERRLLMCDTLLFTALCPLIILTTILAFQIADTIIGPDIGDKLSNLNIHLRTEDIQLIASLTTRLIQMTIVSFIITIDVGFVSWAVLRLQHHIHRWYRWYRRNCKVVLQGYPDIGRPRTIATNESTANVRAISF